MQDAILKLFEFEEEAMKNPEDPFAMATVAACAIYRAVAFKETEDFNEAATLAIMGTFLLMIKLSNDIEGLGNMITKFQNEMEKYFDN